MIVWEDSFFLYDLVLEMGPQTSLCGPYRPNRQAWDILAEHIALAEAGRIADLCNADPPNILEKGLKPFFRKLVQTKLMTINSTLNIMDWRKK